MEISTLLLTIFTVCICLYYFIQKKQSCPKHLKIPHERPVPFFGNTVPFIFKHMSLAENIDRLYNFFPNTKYFAYYNFTQMVYVIRDPHLINAMAIKNFDNFCDHLNFMNENGDPLAARTLFGLKGDHWRKMRKFLSPFFTSSKIKMMYGLICECAENFSNYVASDSKTGKVYNMKEIFSRCTNDVVATCAFGTYVDSFNHPNNEFFRVGQPMSLENVFFKIFLNRTFPWFAKLIRLRTFSTKATNFFKNLVVDIVKIRDEQGIYHPDLIQLMMEARNANNGSFDVDEMAAQALVFFLAGFETTSTAMCFVTYMIAIHPDVQSKLRAEIDNVVEQTNGQPTYYAIKGMKYLHAVLIETLRLYPTTVMIDRMCVKEFELPPATPDGEPVTIKPGQMIWFPLYSLQRDPKYYPQPQKFDADRFLNNENNQMDTSIYMPFGIGPRNCIAQRFAMMEMKIMLFYLLWRCDLEPAPQTKYPIPLDKNVLASTAKGGFWLKLAARKPPAPFAH